MMETTAVQSNTLACFLIEKPGGEQIVYNEQGVKLEKGNITQEAQKETIEISAPVISAPVPQLDQFEDIIPLWDTPLSWPPVEICLCAPTDDSGLEHKVICCWHVLKSTHDLSLWSEKLGSQRVNTAECIDSLDEIITPVIRSRWNNNNNGDNNNRQRRTFDNSNLNANNNFNNFNNNVNRGSVFVQQGMQKSQSWQAPKTGGNLGFRPPFQSGVNAVPGFNVGMPRSNSWGQRRGFVNNNNNNNVNRLRPTGTENIDISDTILSQPQDQTINSGLSTTTNVESKIVSSWPVLKSTHDFARWSEKAGTQRVNESGAALVIDEVAKNNDNTAQQNTTQTDEYEEIDLDFEKPRLQRTDVPLQRLERWEGTENIDIADTPLSIPNEELLPSTGTPAGGSKIIHSWPVLKSTHDAAMLAEKRGDSCVNNFATGSTSETEGFDDISLTNTPLSQPNEPLMPASNEPCEHRIISSGPVLKSTHDMASWSEKSGAHCVNPIETNQVIDEVAQTQQVGIGNITPSSGIDNIELSDTPLSQPNEPLLPSSNEPCEHKVISAGPVLKSTHDMALWSEKSGAHRVNPTETNQVIDEIAQTQQGSRLYPRRSPREWRNANVWTGLENFEIGDTPLSQPNEPLNTTISQGEQQHDSKVLHSWPVLKSTHDNATWSEKSGQQRVNEQGSAMVIDEVAKTDETTEKLTGTDNLTANWQNVEPITVTPPILHNLGQIEEPENLIVNSSTR